MLAHPLALWTSAWFFTMLLFWLGLALLLHPDVVMLARHRDAPVLVIEPKQIYTPLTQPIAKKPPQTRSREFSIVPILGLAMACIVGSRAMMGRMRSYH